MERLINFISRIFLGRRWRRRWQEEMYGSTGGRDGLVGTVREHGGRRTQNVYAIGPLASSDGIGSDEEEVSYFEDKKVITTVKYHEVRRCDCGCAIGRENWFLGTCSVCARVVCSREGCAARCEYCGNLVCWRHSVRIAGHVYCTRHRWYGMWLLFWGLLK